jgi:hypothetical protein
LFLNTGGQSILLTPNLGGSVNRIESSNLPLEIFTSGSELRLAAGGASTQVTLTSSGNVGIGTTAPQTAGGGYTGLHINGNGASLVFSTSGANLAYLYTLGTGGIDFAIENSGAQIFRPGGSERMRITSTGNVGIGTSSPAGLLHVKSSGAYGAILADNTGTTGGGYFASLQNGSTKGIIAVTGAIEGNTTSDFGMFAETGGALRFYVNGSSTRSMSLTSGGNLLVGTTTDNGAKLQVSGQGTFSGSVQINTNTTGLILNRGAVTNYTGIGYLTAGVGQWFVGMRENLSSNNYIIYNENGTDALTISKSNSAATFSSSVTAKGDLFIWGGNAAQAGQITANSAGGGLYIGASGTNQNIRLVPSGTGIVQSLGSFDVQGAATFSSSVTTTFLRVSDSAGQIGEINSSNANGGYIVWQTSGTTIADLGTAQQIFGAGGNDTFGINGRGARAIAFGTNNTERMRIASNGNLILSSTTAGGGTKTTFNVIENGGVVIDSSEGATARYIEFSTGGTPKMFISAAGNVGIGTTSGFNQISGTETTLKIANSNAASLYLEVTGVRGYANYVGGGGNMVWYDYTAGASRITLTSGGNVLIGTTTDNGAKLNVNGTIRSNDTNGLGLGSIAGYRRIQYGSDNATSFTLLTDGNAYAGLYAGAATFSSTLDTLGRVTITADSGNEQFTIRRASNTNAQLITGVHSSGYAWMQSIEQNVAYRPLVLNRDGGNVGIGTSSPATYSGWGGLDVRGTNGGHIIVANTGGTNRGEIFTDGNGFNVSAQTNNALLLKTNDTTRLTITSGGNVLIGTTTDNGARLQVNGGNVTITSGDLYFTSTARAIVFNSAANFNTQIYELSGSIVIRTGGNDRLTLASTGAATFSGNTTGAIATFINTNTAGTGNGLLVDVNSQLGTDNYVMNLITNGTSRMYVREDGLVFMSGLISSFTTGSAANMFVSSGDGAIYRSTSSIKYKKNVEDYTRGLDDVMRLRPVTYNGISKIDSNKTFAGLIAEEVHELGLNEFVQYAEDGTPDALAYQNMIALAFKAIQELKQEIDTLKK